MATTWEQFRNFENLNLVNLDGKLLCLKTSDHNTFKLSHKAILQNFMTFSRKTSCFLLQLREIPGMRLAGWRLRKHFTSCTPPGEQVSEVVRVDHHDVPGRYRISYRLRGHKLEHGPFEYEHQVYYNTEDNKINRLRVLCSGIYEPGQVTG